MESYDRFEKTLSEKMNICIGFFERLSELLKEDYEVIGSCNKDSSIYLVPKGTSDQISYYGKPVGSFRISDHWNWFSSLKRCSDPNEVQCRSMDMPWCRKRDAKEPDKATKPIIGAQVAMYGPDKKYHCIFGERFDRMTKTWSWMDISPEEVFHKIINQEI